ncbi:cytochrome P450, partial [Macrophomina phaseolina]
MSVWSGRNIALSSIALLASIFYVYFYRFWSNGAAVRETGTKLIFSELDEPARRKMYIEDCVSILGHGYQQFKQGLDMYRMTTADGSEATVLNPRYLPELRNLGDEYLSFPKAIESLLAGKWAHIADRIIPLGVSVIKGDLTPNLNRLMPVISEEIDRALERVMPECEDAWQPVCVYKMVQDIVSQVSARIFVGEPLCHDLRWQALCRDYTDKAFGASRAIKQWSPLARPFVFLLLPEMIDLLKTRRDAVRFMTPIVKARALETGVERDDFMEWLKRKSPPGFANDYAEQAEIQCQLAVAAIHTTSMGLTNVIFDLMDHPEYLEPLRSELVSVLKETGCYDKNTMARLKKMDSFMKESQRFNPAGLTSFKRYCMRDVTLSDGKVLPKGTLIEIDDWHQYFEQGSMDRPAEFDGLRYYRLRQEGDKNSHQFATSNPDYLQWGNGRHACPGRFFASNEIKSILSKLILKYDIVPPKEWTGRPPNANF